MIAERLQTDVFEEHAYREEFMAKVRGHAHTQTDITPAATDTHPIYFGLFFVRESVYVASWCGISHLSPASFSKDLLCVCLDGLGEFFKRVTACLSHLLPPTPPTSVSD